MERRKFIANAALGLVTIRSADEMLVKKDKKKMNNLLIHHVFFWLKNPTSEADKAKLIEGLNTLTAIKQLKKYHIGKAASTESRDVIDSSYNVSWYTVFDSIADEGKYQIDPIHTKFVEEYKHLWNKVVVYDSVDA